MPHSVATTNRGRIRPRPESSNPNEPPQWILDKILGLLEESSGGASWQLEEISQAKSAQQEVFVLRFANKDSAAKVLNNNNDNDCTDSRRWEKQRLVLRIWRGGSRWWNLNRNEDPLELAKSEIHGYRVAFQALRDYHDNNLADSVQSRLPRIPRVLHFDLPQPKNILDPDSNRICWAVLEYVGADENDLLMAGRPNNEERLITGEKIEYKVNRSFLKGMIKIRREFGFEELHPRWGRVPVDEALEYASSITKQFLLPLHSHSRKLYCENTDLQALPQSKETSDITEIKSFSSMVALYRKAWTETSTTIKNLQEHAQMNTQQSRIEKCLRYLDKGIEFLSTITTTIPPLDPVLLHLDLQPQNLIFYQHSGLATSRVPRVFSVLDWEDAAFGDPRFDLVLLCRKVCANREQADALWNEYALALTGDGGVTGSYDTNNGIATPCKQNANLPNKLGLLGPIEPWLYLETVHSITTMLLQSMDLVNGGRNPWETKKDLWGKLDREFQRLEAYQECK